MGRGRGWDGHAESRGKEREIAQRYYRTSVRNVKGARGGAGMIVPAASTMPPMSFKTKAWLSLERAN